LSSSHSPYPAVDYDLHGFVGIRLIDASPADALAVSRQLGPLQTELARDPELTIRFVDQLPTGGLRYVGADAAFDDEAFYLLRSKHKAAAKVRFPFQQLGERCEIVCERGAPAVPLLLAVVNLSMLARKVLPLHASAFRHQGRGILVAGWAKGGKTETLLSFLCQGAEYIGDEWIYLTEDGRMLGIPEPIRLWDWHLRQLPVYWSATPRADRRRLRMLRLTVGALSRWSGDAQGRPRRRWAARWAELLSRQQSVQLPPCRLFNASSRALTAHCDTVVFAASHDRPEIVVEPMDGAEIAARMTASLEHERAGLLAAYRQFRFAFPQRSNELLETAVFRERRLLGSLMAGRPALALYHPYPVALPALFEALQPHLPASPIATGVSHAAASATEELQVCRP